MVRVAPPASRDIERENGACRVHEVLLIHTQIASYWTTAWNGLNIKS